MGRSRFSPRVLAAAAVAAVLLVVGGVYLWSQQNTKPFTGFGYLPEPTHPPGWTTPPVMPEPWASGFAVDSGAARVPVKTSAGGASKWPSIHPVSSFEPYDWQLTLGGTVVEIRKSTYGNMDYLYVVLTTSGDRLVSSTPQDSGAPIKVWSGFTALVRIGPGTLVYYCGPGSSASVCNTHTTSGLDVVLQHIGVGDVLGVSADPNRLSGPNLAEAEAALSTLEHREGAANDRLHPLFTVTANSVSIGTALDLPGY